MVFAGWRIAAWGTCPQAWLLIGLLSAGQLTPRLAAAQPTDEAARPIYWVVPSEPAPPEFDPRLPRYTLTLRNPDPSLEWALYRRRGNIDIATPLAECSDATCHITLPRGTYRLAATPLDNRPAHRPAILALYDHRDLTVRPAHPDRARTGRAVALGGAVLSTVGLWYMLQGTACALGGGCDDSGLLLAGGASLTATGFGAGMAGGTYFRYHRRPRLVPTREPSPTSGVE